MSSLGYKGSSCDDILRNSLAHFRDLFTHLLHVRVNEILNSAKIMHSLAAFLKHTTHSLSAQFAR